MVIGLISGCMITGDNYILLVNFLYINFFIKINIHFILRKIFIGNIGFSSNSVTFYVSSYLILHRYGVYSFSSSQTLMLSAQSSNSKALAS